jgi:hypothetical protein
MALTSKPAPQAYTRDTLVKAIEWLSDQPPAVRERANSADLIVSHYLQARRQAAAVQMEAPVSQENFKADLKHLAQDLKRFEEPSPPPHPPTRSPSYVIASAMDDTPATESTYRQETTLRQETIVRHETAARAAVETLPKGVWQIDARSLAIARELQERLNLGHETEALRMLVTLGAERARELFP